MRAANLGSWVGVVGGLVFIMVNAGGLAEPWPVVLRAVGIVAAVTAAVAIVRTPTAEAPVPGPRAIRVYGWSVTAMVVAIPAGASLLNGPLDAPDLTVVWVVAVVGAHFLPFAEAFDAPVFRPLAVTLMAVAAAGAVGALLAGGTAASVTAVVAGFCLLAFAVHGARTTAAVAS